MTLTAFVRLVPVAVMMAGLAACGSDQGRVGTANAMKAAALAASSPLRSKGKDAPAGLGLTRAALADIVTPVDLVTVEQRGAQAVIAKIATNRGVETWSSVDHKTLALRDGVIVATRGLGEDLMSASVPRLAQVQSPSAAYTRVHTVLDGEDKPVYQRFACNTAQRGAESITVVEIVYPTRRVTESCTGPDGSFTNDYWFQTGGKLRKSRQWISKTVGYVVIEHLR